jgi:hypothetical protein
MYRLSMDDAPPSVWGTLTSSSFISLSFITPTPSHFLSLSLDFSVIVNKQWTIRRTEHPYTQTPVSLMMGSSFSVPHTSSFLSHPST